MPHLPEVLLMVVVVVPQATLAMVSSLLNSNMVKPHPNQDIKVNHLHSKGMAVPLKDTALTSNHPKDITRHPKDITRHHKLVSPRHVHHNPKLKKPQSRHQKPQLQ